MTKSQKHHGLTDSPTWIQEMLAHLKIHYNTALLEEGLCQQLRATVAKYRIPPQNMQHYASN